MPAYAANPELGTILCLARRSTCRERQISLHIKGSASQNILVISPRFVSLVIIPDVFLFQFQFRVFSNN